MPIYSHSKLSIYENCPQQFKLRYIDRIELPESKEGIEAFLGSRVHEALEKLHKELILTKVNSLDEIHQYYLLQWNKNWNENTVVIVKKGLTKEHYKNAGLEAITNYYKRHFPFNQTKTLATEHLLVFKIDGYTIQGYLDRLSYNKKGIYEIHDYKASGTLPSQDKLDNDRQLALYQIGLKEKFKDVKDVRLIWHYLLFDKDFTSTRTVAQIKDLKKQVISLIKTIEKDNKFKPVESSLCDWCEYPEYCPAKKHETRLAELPLNKYLKEKGVSLVNKYVSLKAKIKELRDEEGKLQSKLNLIAEAAIEYARKEGITVVTGSDFVLRIIEEKGLQFPRSGEEGREEFERYLKKAEIWEDVSGLNLSRLVKIVEEGEIDNKIRKGILKFGAEMDKMSVRLIKKREIEE